MKTLSEKSSNLLYSQACNKSTISLFRRAPKVEEEDDLLGRNEKSFRILVIEEVLDNTREKSLIIPGRSSGEYLGAVPENTGWSPREYL